MDFMGKNVMFRQSEHSHGFQAIATSAAGAAGAAGAASGFFGCGVASF